MMLPVTMTIAGALALVSVWLATRVSMTRRKLNITDGDGNNPAMRTRIRAHANLTEYAPLVLILLALLELAGQPATWLWAAGALFVLGRLAHPLGLERPGANLLRAGGILTTWGVTLALAVWTLAVAYSHGGAAA